MATVRKRRWKAGGKWREAWIADYADQDGVRRQKTFVTKKAADGWLADALKEVKDGIHSADSVSVTVAEAAELWIRGRALERLEQSTLRQYRQHIDLHIASLVGREKLSRLTTPKVVAFKERLLETRSRAMATKALQSLRAILKDAQRRGLVAQNVATGVTIRTNKRDRTPVAIPSKDEIRLMLTDVPDRWRPLLVTTIFTGMRASELRGLVWHEVDFAKRVIRVSQRADKWGEIGAPKSATSRREIPMTPMLQNTLKAWKLSCPNCELGLVFPNGKGMVESLPNIWNRCLKPLQASAGILGGDDRPKYGIHGLRHFYASWLIEQGFSPKKIQTLLGHSSIQMTFDVYGHLFPSLEDDHARLAEGELALVK